MAKKPTTPDPLLPPPFILAASFALIGAGSSIEAQDNELERAAQLVAPIISRRGLFDGAADLTGVAVEECLRVASPDDKALATATHLDDMLCDVRTEAARIGVHIGLAAGYLLTQFLANPTNGGRR